MKVLGVLAAVASVATAHNVVVEDIYLDGKDSSFKRPLPLGWHFPQSQAVFLSLQRNDVDVISFDIDPRQGKPPGFFTGSPLVYGCEETRDQYPVMALLGPGLPRDLVPQGKKEKKSSPLHKKVQKFLRQNEDYGVMFVENPVHDSRNDAVYAMTENDFTLSWFMPLGLNATCIKYQNCDYSNTIGTFLSTPGTYYVAFWDPEGKPMDITANIGTAEDGTVENEELEELVTEYGLLDGCCTEALTGKKFC